MSPSPDADGRPDLSAYRARLGLVDGRSMSPADRAAIADAKSVLRKAVLTRRQARPDDERAAADATRFEQLQAFIGSNVPDTVACYLSSPPEPGTLQLIAWLAAQQVRVLLPIITAPPAGSGSKGRARPGEPDWATYAGPDALHRGRMSIIEPTTPALGPQSIEQAGLIILPGLAGTIEGLRLGRGGGWYDRALEHAAGDAVLALLLNDDEVIQAVPTHPWDRRVDVIITPSRILPAGSGPIDRPHT